VIARARIFAVHLAFAAMLLRAMLPAGWMPNPGAEAGSPLTICTINGPVQLSPQPLKHTPQHHDICPFSAKAHLGGGTQFASLLPPSPVASRMPNSAGRDFAIVNAGHRPGIPRAPPTLA